MVSTTDDPPDKDTVVPVNSALDVSASQERQRVARVDGERAVLGLHPLPLARLVVPDLERRHWLAEEKGPGAEVRVPAAPETADLLVLLGRVLRVFHVAEVVLRMCASHGLQVYKDASRGHNVPRSYVHTDECS